MNMHFKKVMRCLAFISLGLIIGIAVGTVASKPENASAKSRVISLTEAKKILKKAGYESELSFVKLKYKSHKKTIIYTYPGAKGMDKFSLHPYGSRHVKIYASFGTLESGHFTKINYIHLPKYQVVRR